MTPYMASRLSQQCVAIAVFCAITIWLPAAWNGRLAERWYDGDTRLQVQLANGVAQWLDKGLDRDDFTTGSNQFDGEWLYGTYSMAAMGFGQCTLSQPDRREHYLALMEQAIDELLSDRVRAFDTESWNSDPLESLTSDEGHAAYLGYMNLAMSFHQLLDPNSRFAELNNRISEALHRRVAGSPTLLIESYPYEIYPVDNCAVIASIALNSRARGEPHDMLAHQWAGRCRRKYIDPQSGLLYQAFNSRTDEPYDTPRGSGTTLGLYMLSYMDMNLSRELYEAVEKQLFQTICGFGFMREYPFGQSGAGDIDSGPVIFGLGLSPTGFAISGARIHGSPATFRALYASAHAAGAPLQHDDTFYFVTGASLGDAILFAMLTAPREGIDGVTP